MYHYIFLDAVIVIYFNDMKGRFIMVHTWTIMGVSLNWDFDHLPRVLGNFENNIRLCSGQPRVSVKSISLFVSTTISEVITFLRLFRHAELNFFSRIELKTSHGQSCEAGQGHREASIFFTAVDAGVPLLGFWGREGDAIDPRLEDEGWMNVYQGSQ